MYAPDIAAVATPVGVVMIEGAVDRIIAVRIREPGEALTGSGRAVREAAAQIDAYFAGRLRRFDLPLAAAATARGELLRRAIAGIGFGETVSYGALAFTAGSSARAVGQACARNPFPIVVPCHRVLQAGGRLGPYSAGEGPATKRWLLGFEARGGSGRLL